MENWSVKGRAAAVFAKPKNVDVIVLANNAQQDPNFQYFTDMPGDSFEGGVVLVKSTGVILLANSFEYQDALKRAPKGMEVVKIESRKQIRSFLRSQLKGKKIGMDYESINYATYMRLVKRYHPSRTKDVSARLANARLVKDEREIRQIKRAVHVTKTALKMIQKNFKVGVTEKEIAKEFDIISARLGSDGPSFATMVSFAEHTALPHHSPDGTKLKHGDLVMIDAGSKCGNYCSDMTRTILFKAGNGKIKDHEKKLEILGLVKKAQAHAIKHAKVGIAAKNVHGSAETFINAYSKGKYKDTSMHARGHSLGIEVHDAGNLTSGKTRLKPNMVMTVEPGIYLPGFGGVRFEDDIVITKKGAVIL